MAQARPLPLDGSLQRRTLHMAEDTDWVRFPLAAGDRVSLFTDGPCETFVTLIAPDGRILARDRGNVSATVFTADTYYGRVEHADRIRGTCASYQLGGTVVPGASITPTRPPASPTNTPARATDTPTPLVLTATPVPAADAFEPDDTAGQASRLTLDGNLQQHSLHVPGDADWVFFFLSQDARVRVFTRGTCDSFISLLGPDATTILAQDRNSGPGASSLIERSLATGTYFVRVEHFDRARGACGSYALGGIIVAPMVTPTSFASPTSSPTAPPPTFSPTAAASPTASATATPTLPAIGGQGFSLRLGPPSMSWTGGAVQTGYLIARIGASGTTILPPGGLPLPPNATSYTDTQPIRDPLLCYLLVPVSPVGALGLSDLLCGLPNTRSVGGSPGAFTVQLNPSGGEPGVAALSWTAPGRQDNYVLVALPIGGGVPRQLPLPGNAVQATEDTGGIPTCYLLTARAGTVPIGQTDILCGFPGISTLASNAAPPR